MIGTPKSQPHPKCMLDNAKFMIGLVARNGTKVDQSEGNLGFGLFDCATSVMQHDATILCFTIFDSCCLSSCDQGLENQAVFQMV